MTPTQLGYGAIWRSIITEWQRRRLAANTPDLLRAFHEGAFHTAYLGIAAEHQRWFEMNVGREVPEGLRQDLLNFQALYR